MNWQARKKVDSERKADEFEANKNFKAQNAIELCCLCLSLSNLEIAKLLIYQSYW